MVINLLTGFHAMLVNSVKGTGDLEEKSWIREVITS